MPKGNIFDAVDKEFGGFAENCKKRERNYVNPYIELKEIYQEAERARKEAQRDYAAMFANGERGGREFNELLAIAEDVVSNDFG